MLTPNGFLIQDLTVEDPTFKQFLSKNDYRGVHRYAQDPLTDQGLCRDPAVRELRDRRFSRPAGEGYWYINEFVSDPVLLRDYLEGCHVYGRPCRLLFICSDYTDEVWNAPLPSMTLLGYECCEIPFDNYCIYELLEGGRYFAEHRAKLNEYGLFPAEEDCAAFRDEYSRLLAEDKVGDGEVELFVCAVYEVKTEEVQNINP